jgi:uncharacterized SAM-binding protein YcdF (DUF218 family)
VGKAKIASKGRRSKIVASDAEAMLSSRVNRRTALVTGLLLGALGGHLTWIVGIVSDRVGQSGMEVVGALVGLVVAAVGCTAALLVVDAVLFGASLIVAFTPLSGYLARAWIRDAQPIAPVDAVVVLSSSMASDTALDASATDRLLSGLALVHEGKASRLVTTRTPVRIHGRQLTTEIDQARLVALIPVPRWDVVGVVYTTRDEAVKSAALLLPQGAKHVAVVTSPMHTRRACAAFEHVGFQVTCVATRERNLSTRSPGRATERIEAWREYVYERLGMIKYRWEGWV